MMTPLFSIITICFNSSKTIERTIKSVLSQTFLDYEYIIVDGESTDSTLEIVKQYEPLFGGRLKWKSEPDNGIYDAMNKGIQRSTGTIIGIVNSDDWLEPDALENVENAFISNGRDENTLYCGGMNFHNEDGTIHTLMPDIEMFTKGASEYIMRGVRHPATFVPQKVYQKIGIFDSRMVIMADTDFLLRAYYNEVKIIGVQTVITNMADGGASNALTWKSGKKSFNDKRLLLSNFDVRGAKKLYILTKTFLIIVTKRLFFKNGIKHT